MSNKYIPSWRRSDTTTYTNNPYLLDPPVIPWQKPRPPSPSEDPIFKSPHSLPLPPPASSSKITRNRRNSKLSQKIKKVDEKPIKIKNQELTFSSSNSSNSNEDSSDGGTKFSMEIFNKEKKKSVVIEELNNTCSELTKIKEQIDQLEIDRKIENFVSYYQQKISKLKSENKDLTTSRDIFHYENKKLRTLIEETTEVIKKLTSENDTLTSDNMTLRIKNENLTAVVAGSNFSSLTDEELDDLLQKIMEEKSNRSRCVICLEKPRSVVCTPCGHFCLCIGCSSQVSKRTCPICRAKVVSFTKIYS